MTEKIPEYLERECKKKRKMTARFRCGNEKKRENKYWIEGEQRRYRMCYKERETLEHTWNGCSEMIKRERMERAEKPNEGGREI
jgi:hypothetical protein